MRGRMNDRGHVTFTRPNQTAALQTITRTNTLRRSPSIFEWEVHATIEATCSAQFLRTRRMKLAYFSHHSLTKTSILVPSVLSLLSSRKYIRTLTNTVLYAILSFFSPTGLPYMNSCINLSVMETAIKKRALDKKK